MSPTNDLRYLLQKQTKNSDGPRQISEPFITLEDVTYEGASRREGMAHSPGKPFLQCWAADVVRILAKLPFTAQSHRERKG